jgi:hypothetical protein
MTGFKAAGLTQRAMVTELTTLGIRASHFIAAIDRCLPVDCGGLHGVLTGTGLGSVITQRDVE